MSSSIQQFKVVDFDLKPTYFEDFGVAVRHAVDISTTERVTKVVLPNGEAFTVLKCPTATK